MQDEIKNLLLNDNVSLKENEISDTIINDIDLIIFNNTEQISDEVISVYKKFAPMKQEAPDFMKNNLLNVITNFMQEKLSEKSYIDALVIARFVITKLKMRAVDYNNIAELLVSLNAIEDSKYFIQLYEQREDNLPLRYITVANFYKLLLKDYKQAIKYYEKYLTLDTTKSTIYSILADLYEKCYGDDTLSQQIKYLLKAHKLKPSRLTLHALAFAYEKFGDKHSAKIYYDELLNYEPTPIDLYNYGLFLISCGDFVNGHKYLTNRFLIDDENLKYPLDMSKKWNFIDDISGKTVLVHYEQGFGDTFMYCRFVPMLKNYAKKVIFVVQDEIYDLIKNSVKISEGIEIITSKEPINHMTYDYSIALLDVPHILNLTKETLPLTKRYLEVSQDKFLDFYKKNINKNNKIKVGICLHGDTNANYDIRDITFDKLNAVFSNENCEFYCLQKDTIENENVINLSDKLIDFTDTACAIKGMNFIISTDNVILNLSGALGVKTYALFNKQVNYRWFDLTGDNVKWYESVTPIQNAIQNDWSASISKLVTIMRGYRG